MEYTPPRENKSGEKSKQLVKGGWALVFVIIASLLLIGLPFLGPLFFIAIPILFILTIPALIWFLYQSKKENL